MSEIFNIELLPGREGDCLWIEYGDPVSPSRIIIDGGRQIAYDELSKRFSNLPENQRTFELLICTHVDADHIEGLLKLVEDSDLDISFNDVWFNGYKHLKEAQGFESFGAKQGERLSEGIVKWNWNWNSAFHGKGVLVPDNLELPILTLPGGLSITLLSPTREKLAALEPTWRREVEAAGMVPGITESVVTPSSFEKFGGLSIAKVKALAAKAEKKDTSRANGSSIAFIATYNGKSILMAGDAHADVLLDSLKTLSEREKIKLDAFKLSHHGSRGTISNDLLSLLDCSTFLVSTDGSRHNHPDSEAIAKVLVSSLQHKQLVGNYRSDEMLQWDSDVLKDHFKYELVVPANQDNGIIKVEL